MLERAKNEFSKWCSDLTINPNHQDELQRITDDNEILERFSKNLEFGTGGLRGIIGIGTNRMNEYVIRWATKGLAEYMKKMNIKRSVAIAYDSRNYSEFFAWEAAKVLAANQFEVWIYPRLQPTPALSFAVRALKCGAGICVTASHNPAEYNGYKVYDQTGCQITQNAAEAIASEMQRVSVVEGAAVDMEVDKGSINLIPETVLEQFLNHAKALSYVEKSINTSLNVVYTPLNGAGRECVLRVLEDIGIRDISVVKAQELPNGDFPTCPYPNPEDERALALGIELCKEKNADLLLATDPDCDRVGVAVKHREEYLSLSGNEMGVLLFDYICENLQKNGKMPDKPVAITTIVSTDMAEKIAEKYGVELRRTLTGFKYIGEQIGLLEMEGREDRYIFGFEESYGYLPGTFVRDKDAVSASLMICEMTAYYKKRGITLIDKLNELFEIHGTYKNILSSVSFPGVHGNDKMKKLMEQMRENSPKEVNGVKVVRVVDYLETEKTKLPIENVLELNMEDRSKLIIRPSGTEPKMKLYISSIGKTLVEAEKNSKAIEKSAYAILEL